MAKLQARIAEVDTALADPAKAPKPLAGMNLGALGKLRSQLTEDLETLEAQWLEWSEQAAS
jgi:ATP-binding cassette subfamily F protein 3